jgi:hypothetical protein
MFKEFTQAGRLVIFFARYEAVTTGSDYIQPHHLAIAIRHLCPEMPAIAGMEGALSVGSVSSDGRKDLPMSEGSRRVIRNAVALAQALWRSDPVRRRILHWFSAAEQWFVDPRHILLALAEDGGPVAQELRVQLFGPDAVAPTMTMPSGIPETLRGKHTGKLGVILLCSRYEAMRLGSGAIRPEHLLLGLLFSTSFPSRSEAIGESLGSQALLRQEVLALRQSAEGEPGELNPDAQEVLEHAAGEAALLGHPKVGSSHLLLGLMRTGNGFAAEYLKRHGVELERARATVAGVDLP